MQCAVFNFSLPTVSPVSFSRFLGCLWYYQAVEFAFTKSFTVGNFFLLFTPLHQCAVTWNFTFKDFPPPAPSAINSIFCLSSWNLESLLGHSFSSRQLPGIRQAARPPLHILQAARFILQEQRSFYVFQSGLDVTEQLLGLSWMFVKWYWVSCSEDFWGLLCTAKSNPVLLVKRVYGHTSWLGSCKSVSFKQMGVN